MLGSSVSPETVGSWGPTKENRKWYHWQQRQRCHWLWKCVLWLTIHNRSWCRIISWTSWAPPTASSISSCCLAIENLFLWWWQENKLGAITMETFHRDILFWSWWETTLRRKTSRAYYHGNTSSNRSRFICNHGNNGRFIFITFKMQGGVFLCHLV